MACASFSIGIFLSFRKVLVLITFISAPVSVLKIIGISPIFNFTCQESIFLSKFILAYRSKEISIRRLFPYFAKYSVSATNNIFRSDSFYHSFCNFFLLLGCYQICDICCTFYITTYSLPFVDTFSILSVLWVVSFPLLPHPLSYLTFSSISVLTCS